MKKLTLLGDLTAAQFLHEYWHKKPLLIRQALPGFKPVLRREALFKLASQEDVESRLITHFMQKWKMRHGPFAHLPTSRQKHWTLLVQGANLHNDGADALLRKFSFIGDARLDDLLISYASDGGGVGPHFDSYDVFLLQAHGQRRWRISAQKDKNLIEGMPLKILQNFEPEQEFVLDPGDMLYLPPHFAHDGVALGECMTYSIGFRAPTFQELGDGLLQFMADSIDLPGRFADPDLEPTNLPAKIGRPMLAKVTAELNKVRITNDDVAIFLGEYLSDPKAHTYFTPPSRPLTPARFKQRIVQRGVALSRRTQMLYQGKYVFVNGESFVLKAADKAPLHALANTRQMGGPAAAETSQDVMAALYAWYQAGWLDLQ